MQNHNFPSTLHIKSKQDQHLQTEKSANSTLQKLNYQQKRRINTQVLLLTLFLSTVTQHSLAEDIYATTESGARVILKDDYSWSYIDEDIDPVEPENEPVTQVDLKVMGKWTEGNSCRIGLSLMNKRAEFIRNLGLEFTAYVANGLPFDSVIIGFYGIKPTRHQYREAIYQGIKCHEINHILVHGGDRCSVGEALVKFSTADGECLQAINVIKSDLINIHK